MTRIEELLVMDPSFAETIVRDETAFSGRVFSAHELDVELADGTASWREIVRHSGGAGAAALVDGKLCLVRQYRVALGRMTLEIPAGRIEPGEDPAECARRELREETGLVAQRMVPLAVSAGSPGFTDERTRIYLAEGLEAGQTDPDEGEKVDAAWIDLDEVVEAIRAGLIQDAKTIVAALALACER